jgi:tetratricopeptide (TPR) repeat protein
LIRPDRPQLPGEDGFRFRHLLIRDAAYDALPKTVRAELHERFAAWREQHDADLVELDEILGYHLEQACRYRSELGMSDDGRLAEAARARLAAAGRHAFLRGDSQAAANLLERAEAFVPPDQVDPPLELDRADALFQSGKPKEALRVADSVAQRASRADDRIGELCALIWSAEIRTQFAPEGAADASAALAKEALPMFEVAGDDFALFVAYRALSTVAQMRGLVDEELAALENALMHARKTGFAHHELSTQARRALAWFFGSTPVSELLARLDDEEANGVRHPSYRCYKARALAMLGRFTDARSILADLRAESADRGAIVTLALITGLHSAPVELMAGCPKVAVELGRKGCRLLQELGEQSFLSTGAGLLAQSHYDCGELDEADDWARRAAALGARDDAITQMLWRQARAKVLARRGEHAEAQRLAREAVTIGDDTDLLDTQGGAYADLAEVLLLGGKPDETAAALEQALDRYERKGNRVSTQRAQTRLAELQAAASR